MFLCVAGVAVLVAVCLPLCGALQSTSRGVAKLFVVIRLYVCSCWFGKVYPPMLGGSETVSGAKCVSFVGSLNNGAPCHCHYT